LDYDLCLLAFAKVNLSLEVVGKRPDGYHEVRSVMHTVSLADRLELAWDRSGDITLTSTRPDLATEDNLALRAVRALHATWPSSIGIRMHLVKNIPVAAGLGGGSSDAAAALYGATFMWSLARTPEDLLEQARELGSDVPFFLVGGCGVARGRGDDLALVQPIEGMWLVLLTPPVELENKTARLYGALTPEHYTRGEATAELGDALLEGRRPGPGMLVNVFEQIALQFFPDLTRYSRAMRDAGATSVHMSGSGPTLYTVVPDEAEGRAMVGRLAEAGFAAVLVQTVPHAWDYGPPSG
jgi:4-diphosphocytidyl-2-C-methyl-D-erythritol kinase